MRHVRNRYSVVFASFLFLCFVALADGFHIPPHLQNITSDGATLIWETQDEGVGVVEYGIEGKLDQQAKEAQPAKIHRVRITGLTPETSYSYRVRAAAEERANTFKTAPTPAAARAITFAVIGDSRRWENRWQETRMTEHMMQWNPEFVINNGDLVVGGHKYDLWPEHFARFADVIGYIMMVSARGNHEGSGKVDPEHDWFAKYHELPGAGEPFSAFDWGNTHFVVVSMESVMASGEALEDSLAASKAKHTVVVFHYPVYCAGYMSPEDSRKDDGERMAGIRKVLDKYHVSLHLSGHTHIYERSWPIYENKRDDRQGTTYIVQGGDINSAYPEWWTAAHDDPSTMAKPTYTVLWCKDDRIETRTFCWGTQENKIIEIDRAIFCRDASIPAALMADLPNRKGAELAQGIDDLGAMIYTPAAKTLAGYVADPDASVRRAAAKALRSTGAADVAEALLPALKDSEVVVRRDAARALEIAMPESLAKAVAEQAQDKEQDDVARASLVGALEAHAPAGIVRQTVLTILKSDAPAKVRNRAAYALAQVAEKDDMKAIAKLFENEPERFAMLRMAFTLNKLAGHRISLDGKQPLANSKPGNRHEFTKEWLSGN